MQNNCEMLAEQEKEGGGIAVLVVLNNDVFLKLDANFKAQYIKKD